MVWTRHGPLGKASGLLEKSLQATGPRWLGYPESFHFQSSFPREVVVEIHD